ncbi:hypothetical protein D1BOALGB6SA_1637 [Olavius sp. associated proteobacterium Delta 1]|nr:hypothetical protein D1BOALGB6SA_1637 [Olavius sp. associated proteobacterium Delta 1]
MAHGSLEIPEITPIGNQLSFKLDFCASSGSTQPAKGSICCSGRNGLLLVIVQ